MELSERRLEFLRELSALTNRYNLVIGACGCCGSPWFADEHAGDGRYILKGEDTLEWVRPSPSRATTPPAPKEA